MEEMMRQMNKGKKGKGMPDDELFQQILQEEMMREMMSMGGAPPGKGKKGK